MQLTFPAQAVPTDIYTLLNAVGPSINITIFGRSAVQLNYSFVLSGGTLFINLAATPPNLAAIADAVVIAIEDALTS